MQTEAWVLHEGADGAAAQPAELSREELTIAPLGPQEVLARPIYGCWEGNMYHALSRSPIDVCRFRGEAKLVPGNAGVVEVLETSRDVTKVRAGDLCIVFPNASPDRYGYMQRAYAYDAPGTMGILARITRMPEHCVIPIPKGTRHSLRQWAAFSARYVTAWANWNVSLGCWRTQMTPEDMASPHVWAWGGGVALAELTLAARHGARVAMLASRADRLALLQALGIEAIDRRRFDGLSYDEARYAEDAEYRQRYKAAEKAFLSLVSERTGGEGVSIFIDNLGTPVYRATLKALARQGVITTCGWRHGMNLAVVRATESIARHIHVFTHFARYAEGLAATRWAEEHDWMPPDEPRGVYAWEDIPRLAEDYAEDRVASYFPLYQINPERT
ncbi:MAG TPA: zinc-binding dehydrogenase [Kofleriaceae bacterium]|nr:zinc-binding dehydrogenase [Kofleriaceae bacterium]